MTDTQQTQVNTQEDYWRERRKRGRDHNRDSNKLIGLLILVIGVVALLKAFLVPMPVWLFTWPMILILIGTFLAIKHRFHGVAWLILLLIGGVFLIEKVYPELSMRQYSWPIVLIVIGLFIVLRPRRSRMMTHFEMKMGLSGEDEKTSAAEAYSQEDFVDATSIFGGTKKNIISKNFRGGDLVNIFGGSEINLSQADFTGTAVIELTTIFGGTTLIVPSNWTVQSEAVTIFGGLEDKRRMDDGESRDKLLLIKGTVLFGGIDIKSYK